MRWVLQLVAICSTMCIRYERFMSEPNLPLPLSGDHIVSLSTGMKLWLSFEIWLLRLKVSANMYTMYTHNVLHSIRNNKLINKQSIRRLTNAIGFSSGKLILRKVCIHLISIKVSIVALAVSIVKTKCFLTWENPGLLSEQTSLICCTHYKTNSLA